MRKIITTLAVASAATLLGAGPSLAAGIVTPNPVAPGAAVSFSINGCLAGAPYSSTTPFSAYIPGSSSRASLNGPAPTYSPRDPVVLTAPATPGSYEVAVEYVNGVGTTIQVTACTVSFVVAEGGNVPLVHPLAGVAGVAAVASTVVAVRRRRRVNQ